MGIAYRASEKLYTSISFCILLLSKSTYHYDYITLLRYCCRLSVVDWALSSWPLPFQPKYSHNRHQHYRLLLVRRLRKIPPTSSQACLSAKDSRPADLYSPPFPLKTCVPSCCTRIPISSYSRPAVTSTPYSSSNNPRLSWHPAPPSVNL
ncbi:hypothetical protein BU26DRAFT_291920 [Trematosphaeria pertusa]|uniref:Uncharacterized protein n=1 Tax=Trematosphaeria pertusa TaxID=390896 RepID=A0A6A6IIL7_9PLEO|nr:uncharacterized protein BU26DRAFT_291920 [Trematosphaeria pertusa]KAF2249888.1 hypothetical protein BU26DRAFT_291920 [Trematosphaeria pertusa]